MSSTPTSAAAGCAAPPAEPEWPAEPVPRPVARSMKPPTASGDVSAAAEARACARKRMLVALAPAEPVATTDKKLLRPRRRSWRAVAGYERQARRLCGRERARFHGGRGWGGGRRLVAARRAACRLGAGGTWLRVRERGGWGPSTKGKQRVTHHGEDCSTCALAVLRVRHEGGGHIPEGGHADGRVNPGRRRPGVAAMRKRTRRS